LQDLTLSSAGDMQEGQGVFRVDGQRHSSQSNLLFLITREMSEERMGW